MTQDVETRMMNHREGVRSNFVHWQVKNGNDFELVQWWRVPDGEDPRKKEKRAKAIAKYLCPYCSPAVTAYKRIQAERTSR
jgi:predicted GIY-YIG superfamily endonuclease